jgi:molybdopterin synthase catalytic subunit
MRVRVLFFGVLKDLVGCAEDTIEVDAGTSVGDVFEQYSQRFETLRGKRPSILFARNQEFTVPDALLADHDEIAFLPPVSGGSGNPAPLNERHIFSLLRGPINARSLAQQMQRPEDGAVITFEGVVRNNTKGRPTLYLDYEGYEPLAVARMRQIGLEITRQFDLGGIGIVHRLGRLEVGDASVAIVTTAAHRRPAYDASILAIDRLKREVPIWKKEYFEDGAVWVEGAWDDALFPAASINVAP